MKMLDIHASALKWKRRNFWIIFSLFRIVFWKIYFPEVFSVFFNVECDGFKIIHVCLCMMCMLQIEEFYRASNFSEFLKHYKEIWISKFEQMCLKNNASYHLKCLNSPLICRADQWTGFYMTTAPVMKEL